MHILVLHSHFEKAGSPVFMYKMPKFRKDSIQPKRYDAPGNYMVMNIHLLQIANNTLQSLVQESNEKQRQKEHCLNKMFT